MFTRYNHIPGTTRVFRDNCTYSHGARLLYLSCSGFVFRISSTKRLFTGHKRRDVSYRVMMAATGVRWISFVGCTSRTDAVVMTFPIADCKVPVLGNGRHALTSDENLAVLRLRRSCRYLFWRGNMIEPNCCVTSIRVHGRVSVARTGSSRTPQGLVFLWTQELGSSMVRNPRRASPV
jgi:hypothetical protein